MPPFVVFTIDMDQTLIQLRGQGNGFAYIARRVGVDRRTLMKRVDALGMSRRRGKITRYYLPRVLPGTVLES